MTTADTRRPLWQRTWVRVTGSIAALALVAGAGAAGTALASPHTVTNRPAATAPAHPKAKAPARPAALKPASTFGLAVGQMVTIHGTDDNEHPTTFTVRVNSIKPWTPGQYDDPAPAGKQYITANVTYRAITGPAYPNALDWETKTPNGQTYDQPGVSGDTSLSSNTIQAGALATGDVYLQLPAGTAGMLVYSNGLGEAASWTVPGSALGRSPAPAPAAQTATPAAPAQQQAPAPAPASPQLSNGVSVVLQFYQDLTNHDYGSAWNLGGRNLNGGVGYSAWVAGYATTASIAVTSYGTWGDGTVWTHLSAAQTDGTVKTYDGTYTVAGGVIVSAHMTQTS
jgi:hypothetical protein